ncbi:hypothetical protein BGW80DRAFT_1322342 [Lactifluus volemus]|nr:hypothetical protein BGW80DRAFT_1322342 [Lactifluus volemus]
MVRATNPEKRPKPLWLNGKKMPLSTNTPPPQRQSYYDRSNLRRQLSTVPFQPSTGRPLLLEIMGRNQERVLS